jgi:MEMO1 family protein
MPAETVQQADLAIVFGTDHFSEGFPFSLTRQNYATPYGVLPTAVEIVDRLAASSAGACLCGRAAPPPRALN